MVFKFNILLVKFEGGRIIGPLEADFSFRQISNRTNKKPTWFDDTQNWRRVERAQM